MKGLQKIFQYLSSAFIVLLLTNIPAVLAEQAEAPEMLPPFSDVEEGDPHYIAINYLRDKGLIQGYADNTFQSHKTVNRAEALKMLTLASGLFSEEEFEDYERDDEAKRPFTDTPLKEWYTPYLISAKEAGVINGYPDESFRPNEEVNLAESLKMYLEALDKVDYENVEYTNLEQLIVVDTPADAWFTPYTKFALSEGLINLYADNTIDPTQKMSRGYLAEVIYRSLKAEEGYKFGRASWYGSAVDGNLTASGETFDSTKFTAAHKYLPLGTYVEVTNLANGKSVEVKINDRGPYGHGRVIDLSSSAFSEIAWTGTGLIDVEFTITHLP